VRDSGSPPQADREIKKAMARDRQKNVTLDSNTAH